MELRLTKKFYTDHSRGVAYVSTFNWPKRDNNEFVNVRTNVFQQNFLTLLAGFQKFSSTQLHLLQFRSTHLYIFSSYLSITFETCVQ